MGQKFMDHGSAMLFWLVVCLIYETFRTRNTSLSLLLRVGGYFLLVFALSSISLHFFPLSGDEILYAKCGEEMSHLISRGFLWDFSQATCAYGHNNFFVKMLGYVFFFGGDGPFSLIGFNAFLMYVSCQLMMSAFDPRKEFNKLRSFAPFFPPLLYLALRPAKEALIAFLISALCFGVSRPQVPRKLMIVLSSLFLFWLVRWQFAVTAIFAVGVWLLWLQFVNLRTWGKVAALLIAFIFCGISWKFYGNATMDYLYNSHFGYSNVFHHQETSQATLYKFMIFQGGEGSLHPWNLIIASVGGFITPHPLRFIKEFLRDGSFKFHILEEFLYVSFWFYALIPVYFLYFQEVFLKKWRRMEEIPPLHVFSFLLAFSLFSLACLSLLYQTPQMFRYKVPLNIYLFTVIALFIHQKGFRNFFKDFLEKRKLHFAYLTALATYTVFYFHLAFKV